MNIDNDTIVARSTPPGFGAISIIRLSGPDVLNIIERTTDISRKKIKPKQVMRCNFVYKGTTTDEIMLTYFQKPHSYTGQHVVEISCHGSPAIVREIIDKCILAGARHAQAGEFTKRRFLNNKIDLTQAEGINNLIHSQTSAAIRSSKKLLEGTIGKDVRSIKKQIIDNISLLELELDFTEEEIDHTPKKRIHSNIIKLINDVSHLINSYQYGRLITNGLKIALIGPPNSGKSSLLNAILKEERAITSAKAGTTRDFIQESIDHQGYKLTFIDTAGIRKPVDDIENKGISKAKKVIKSCDLRLLIIDPNQPCDNYKEFVSTKTMETFYVINKIDISDRPTIDRFLNYFDINKPILVSALQATNIDYLNDAIIKWLESKKPTGEGDIITIQRHYNILKNTRRDLKTALKAVKRELPSEFIVTDLRHALSTLDEILGKTTNEEILNNIFNNFCIGK